MLVYQRVICMNLLHSPCKILISDLIKQNKTINTTNTCAYVHIRLFCVWGSILWSYMHVILVQPKFIHQPDRYNLIFG